MIAAGSGERLFPGMQIGDGVMTSKEALVHDRIPSSIIVIGAGAIGLEFGYFYQAFGSQVTIIELEKQMLPGFDAEIAEELRRNFIKRKVTVLLGHGYKSMQKVGDKWSVDRDRRRRRQKARGRKRPGRRRPHAAEQEPRPRESRHRGRARRLHQDRRFVPHHRQNHLRDRRRRSALPCSRTRPPPRASRRSKSWPACASPDSTCSSIAGCIYCEPEVATVGLSEAEAKARGIEVKVGKFPFRALGKAIATNSTEGFVKLVVSTQYGEVVGCQIIGHHATDLISEVVLGKTLEATNIEFGKTVHPHPTMSEAIMEAALAADGEAINI